MTISGNVPSTGSNLMTGRKDRHLDWKTVSGVLVAIVMVIGFGMEAYKKNIRGDGTGKTRAGKREIALVAAFLSLVFSLSFGIGLGFPGLPWAFQATRS